MRKWYLFGFVVLAVGLIAPAGYAGEEAAAAPAPEAAPAPAPEAAPAPAPAPPLPLDTEAPRQVNVSVKVVEFQTEKNVETGFSAFFSRRNKERLYGRVTSGNGAIRTADLTFPTDSGNRLEGLTVFLDNISTNYGDIEMVLQALVDENRAYILSRPKAMVMIGAERPGTVIKTVREIPYEDTTVVGATTVQATSFRDTGVALTLKVPKVTDDDGNWATLEDTYVNLQVQAEVKELGSRIVIALDDSLGGGNQITAPVFITRSIMTDVWVRNGQVLVLGGLYRNTKQKSLETVPWLTQAEDVAVGVAENFIPGNFIGAPLSTTFGHREADEGRRELVFFIKSELWRAPFVVADEHGFVNLGEETPASKVSPTGLLTDILEGVSSIPQNLGDAITGGSTGTGIDSELKMEEDK